MHVVLFINSRMPGNGRERRISRIHSCVVPVPSLALPRVISLASFPRLPISFLCSECTGGSPRPHTSNSSLFPWLSVPAPVCSLPGIPQLPVSCLWGALYPGRCPFPHTSHPLQPPTADPVEAAGNGARWPKKLSTRIPFIPLNSVFFLKYSML